MFKKAFCLGIFIFILLSMNFVYAKEYYPNNVGNLWVLEARDGSEEHRIEINDKIFFGNRDLNILRRQTKNGSDTFYIATQPDGEIKLYWSKVHNGLLGDIVSEYSPPQTFIPADISVGKRWQIIGEAGQIGTQTNCSVVAKEDVRVPAGTFSDCLKVQQDFVIKAFLTIRVQSFMWLAPNIGIVKEQNTNKVVFELVEYKLLMPWDINNDYEINIYDLVLIGSHFGEQIVGKPENNPDANGDGVVNIFDLVLVGSHFGEKYSF